MFRQPIDPGDDWEEWVVTRGYAHTALPIAHDAAARMGRALFGTPESGANCYQAPSPAILKPVFPLVKP